ncbi:MAG TPA: DUF3352 domain-containing protein [Solirubrobacteraceae bacterium]
MRRVLLLLTIVVVSCASVVGCGSNSPSTAPNPVNSELSYFPASSPLVASIATNSSAPEIRNLGAMIGNYPIAAFGLAYAKTRLQQLGINYDTDVHPLFGNPIMLGLADSNGVSSRTLLIAWVTRDANALATLVSKFHVTKTRTYDGATLYALSSIAVAVDGPTVLLGTSQQALMGALDRHARGGGVTQAEMSAALAGLPPHPFLAAFGSLTGVLSSQRAAAARRVPWVAALRGYAVTLNASSAGLSVNFKLDTTGAPLAAAELPISTVTAPPGLVGGAPIQVGIQDPSQLVYFLEQASQRGGLTAFLMQQAAVHRKTGVDLKSLLGLLTGELAVNSNGHGTIAEIRVKNPGAAATILAKLSTVPNSVLPHSTLTRRAGGFYQLNEQRRTINLGIIGSELLAGNVPPSQLRQFAAAPLSPAPSGSHGAVAFRIALSQLIHLAVKNAPSQLQTLLGSLGDITGWIAATPQALTGAATLPLK